MSYLLAAWLASIAYGFEVIFGKLTSKYAIDNPWLFNFAWSLFIIFLTLPVALANRVGLPTDWASVWWATIFYALSNLFYILALSKLEVSVISPLFSFRTVFQVLFAVLLLGEILTVWQLVLIAVIVAGAVIVNINEKGSFKAFFSFRVLLTIVAMLAIALYGVFVKKAMALNRYWEVVLWVEILAQIIFLMTIPFFYREVRKTKLSKYSGVLAMAVAGCLGILASNYAYKFNVAISGTITALPFSFIFAILLSLIAPKLLEKHTAKIYLVRIAATAVMIWAGILLSR